MGLNIILGLSKKMVNKIISSRLFTFLFFLVCVLISWIIYDLNYLSLSPDSYYYLSQSEIINKQNFSVFFQSNLSTPYYWFFPIMLFILKTIFSSYFLNVIFVIQFILFTFSANYLFLIYKALYQNALEAFFVALFFIFFYDIAQWGHYLLTDIYSLFFNFLFIHFILTRNKNGRFVSIITFLIVLIMLTLRASNLIIVVCTFIFIIIRKDNTYLTLPILIASVFIMSFLFIPKKTISPFSINNRVEIYKSNLLLGQIVDDRPLYDIIKYNKKSNEFIYSLKVISIRAINYWRFYCEEFSKIHNLLNFILFIPYFLGIYYFLFERKLKKSLEEKYLLSIIAIYFFSNIFTMIDYDWRYRVPPLSISLIISLNGLAFYYKNRFSNHFKKKFINIDL